MMIVALEDFRNSGKEFEAGKPYDVPRSNASLLIRSRKAKLWITPAPDPVPEPMENPIEVDGFPDLRPCFKHTEWRVTPHSRGALVCSDFSDKKTDDPVFGIYKQCGFWTVGEIKILFSIARIIGGYWLDIGGLTGWTAAHMASAGCHVASLDPMYANPEFRARAVKNLTACGIFPRVGLWTGTSNELFARSSRIFSGIVIDGEHRKPQPLQDATYSAARVVPNGVILFHDAAKAEVRDGYRYLESHGWKMRYYNTPYGVALCYRDGFTPPETK